jgi:hypothetical protein
MCGGTLPDQQASVNTTAAPASPIAHAMSSGLDPGSSTVAPWPSEAASAVSSAGPFGRSSAERCPLRARTSGAERWSSVTPAATSARLA